MNQFTLKSNKSIKALALVYGVYSTELDTPSWIKIGDGTYGLSVRQMQWIWDGYLGGQDINPKDPRLSPLNANLNGLAPTWVMVGDLDPLLDDNIALNKALELAGWSIKDLDLLSSYKKVYRDLQSQKKEIDNDKWDKKHENDKKK